MNVLARVPGTSKLRLTDSSGSNEPVMEMVLGIVRLSTRATLTCGAAAGATVSADFDFFSLLEQAASASRETSSMEVVFMRDS